MAVVFGTVFDLRLRVVPGVHVVAVESDGNVAQILTADSRGFYRIEFPKVANIRRIGDTGHELRVSPALDRVDPNRLHRANIIEQTQVTDQVLRIDLSYSRDPFPLRAEWNEPGPSHVTMIDYTCAFCGTFVAPTYGYRNSNRAELEVAVYLCPRCNQPTYFDHLGEQHPRPAFGDDVPSIGDQHIGNLYREARNCMSIGAYTAAVLTCRKLILDVAEHARTRKLERLKQDKKDTRSAEKSLTQFADAMHFLSGDHYIPQQSRAAFDLLPRIGGEATHSSILIQREVAEWVVKMVEYLLRLIYQYPNETDPRTLIESGVSMPETPSELLAE